MTTCSWCGQSVDAATVNNRRECSYCDGKAEACAGYMFGAPIVRDDDDSEEIDEMEDEDA